MMPWKKTPQLAPNDVAEALEKLPKSALVDLVWDLCCILEGEGDMRDRPMPLLGRTVRAGLKAGGWKVPAELRGK